MSKALDRLGVMLGDVDNLLDYHPAAKAPVRGRPPGDSKPLLRSCVVLTYAAWEVYVEDSMIEIAESIAGSASGAVEVPAALRAFVASWCKDPWCLAGDGWRKTITDAVTERVRGDEATTFGINTAGPKQVSDLHRDLLGVELLKQCKWQNMPNAKVRSELAALVKVRGKIVHAGTTPGDLDLKGTRAWRDFIDRLTRTLDGRLSDWLASRR
ncbi:HEPN domain-containing protein [Micromonospora musae]|uniref:HEPN domain-containing protein n=1 Tax=Micromonospora musae TaxID=1894970 RepID=UPI00341ACE04